MQFKTVNNGYITSIGFGEYGVEITEDEYDTILEAINNRPKPPLGYDYRLRTDLTWEIVELPSVPDEPTVYTQTSLEAMTNAELEQILYGYGITASMNKANMIRLILQAQGDEEE